MAFPVIRVNSVSGSDSAASGAGPATAVTGASGAWNSTTSVDLSGDAPDLSGVATDGSAVFYAPLGTAGVSGLANFYKITNVNNSTKIVTVTPAMEATGSGSWAIGGDRASIGSARSRLLFDNAGGTGDAGPGWVVELQDAHAETLTDRLLFRINGDTTDGSFTLRGPATYSTLPLLTWSTNDIASLFPLGTNNHVGSNFGMRNSNGTKTTSEAIRMQTSNGGNILGINFNPANTSGDAWFRHVNVTGECALIQDCRFGYCADDAVRVSHGGSFSLTLRRNTFTTCPAYGLNCASGSAFVALTIEDNEFYDTTTPIYVVAANSVVGRLVIAHNTIDGTSGSPRPYAIYLDGTNTGYTGAVIENNTISNLSTEALHLDDLTLPMINAYGMIFRGNNFYNVTSKYNIAINSQDELTVDPQFADVGSFDFTVGANLKGKAYPDGSVGARSYSGTATYRDVGANQGTSSGGGGGRGLLTGGGL